MQMAVIYTFRLLHPGRGNGRSSILYTADNGRWEMGLGSAAQGNVTLAEAREKAIDVRRLLAQGIDPIDARNGTRAISKAAGVKFGKFADDYIESHKIEWSNIKHADQWSMTLGEAYCSLIRQKPVGAVCTDDILTVLEPVWQTVPETARRVRMRLEKVLDAARVRGLRTGENPARWKGHLDHLLPKHSRSTRGHHAALPWAELPNFLKLLENREGVAALAFQFLILTASRTGEVLGARWSELDIEKALWTIPASRMKSRREHRVPLSKEASALIRSIQRRNKEFVFAGPIDTGPLSNMALLMLLRRINRKDITGHGMRSTFRDWAAECTNFPSEVCEMALAHVVENATEAAYRRGDLLDKRRKLMEAWSSCCKSAEKVKILELRPKFVNF
jgi:integrase